MDTRLVAAALLAGLSGTACTLLLDAPVRQCQSHADCQALGTEYVCASDLVCVKFETDERPLEARAGAECTRDIDCAEGTGLALCRDGTCRPLNDRTVGCVSNGWGTTSVADQSDVLPIGMLVPAAELSSAGLRRITGAVATAIGELNLAREVAASSELPPLVGVACDEARPEGLDYLLSVLGVRLIVGPSESSRVTGTLERTGTQALLVAPSADGPDLAPGADDPAGYLLSCKPNRVHLRAALLAAAREARAEVAALGATGLATITAALAVSSDASTQSFASGLNDSELASAQLRRVTYAVQPGGGGLVNALQGLTPWPNLIIAASTEDAWQDNIAAFDGASWNVAHFYPYYLLGEKSSAVQAQALSDQATASGFPRQYLRLLGLDYHRDAQSALAYQQFSDAFLAQTQSTPEPGVEYAYDCTYLAVYAAVAAAQRLRLPVRDLPPGAIMAALGALQGNGPLLPLRALDILEIVGNLAARRGADGAVNLTGASGSLDLESVAPRTPDGATNSRRQYWAPGATDVELYCIDASSKKYCDTGVVFPQGGGEPSRAESRCSCLREE